MNTNPEIEFELLLQAVPVTCSEAVAAVQPLPASADESGSEEMAVAA